MGINTYLKKYINIKNEGVIEVDNPYGIYYLRCYNIRVLENITIILRIRDYPKIKCPKCKCNYTNWTEVREKTCRECKKAFMLLER